MPYIEAPPAARFRDRLASSTGYLVLASTGLWVSGFSGWLSLATAALLICGGIIASLGAVLDHYQIEWAAMAPVTAGALGMLYIAIAWASTQDRAAGAVVGLALFCFIVLLQRWNRLVSIAAKDRAFNRLRRK